MGMIQHKEFSNGAQMLAHYAEIRKRLFKAKPKLVYVAAAKPDKPKRVTPQNRGKRPLWCIKDIQFDEHVRRYYGLARKRERGSAAKVSIAKSPKPMWKTGLIQYNHHVLAYRKMLLAKEEASTAVESDLKSMDEIAAEVISKFDNLDIRMLKGPSRTIPVALARQLLVYEIKNQRPDLSWGKIALYLGGRDHSTAMHAYKKINSLREEGRLSFYFQ
jgi:Bacterial dnaA protein helix-turn-helix